jgi:hypothetical protein
VAYDDATGRELWQLQVYSESAPIEDSPDLFISALRFDRDGVLLVVDQAGRSHRVDVEARQVL